VVVCKKVVGNNSILCTKSNKLVHKRCSKLKGRIGTNVDFQCLKCCDLVRKDITYDKRNLMAENGVEFECVDRFCYLGDMSSAGGGADFSYLTRAVEDDLAHCQSF